MQRHIVKIGNNVQERVDSVLFKCESFENDYGQICVAKGDSKLENAVICGIKLHRGVAR